MKAWRLFGDLFCSHCGDNAEIYTEEDGYAYEDDDARCCKCGCPGIAGIEDDGFLYVSWHDEPDCDCD